MTIAVRWPDAIRTLVADFPAAWAAARAQPELCLADLDMPGATARDGIAGVVAAAPAARLIVVTASRDDALLVDLLALGISGFLPKTSEPAVITAAIDLVLAGGRYLPPQLVEIGSGVQPASPQPASPQPASPQPASPLSDRQAEVVALLAKGHSNKEIARQLCITPATVKTHVAQVLAALGAANRTDAAIKARELGVI